MSDKKIIPKQDTQRMICKIGSTVYRVNVHFSKRSNERLSDKIIRLIKNDITQDKAAS